MISFTDEEIKRLLEDLDKCIVVGEKLADLPDVKIGELLFYHLWLEVGYLTPHSELVMQAVLRLGFNPKDNEE